MITKIEIRNFRCIASARLEPKAINLIVGPNGSGKTSILRAISEYWNYLQSQRVGYLIQQGEKVFPSIASDTIFKDARTCLQFDFAQSPLEPSCTIVMYRPSSDRYTAVAESFARWSQRGSKPIAWRDSMGQISAPVQKLFEQAIRAVGELRWLAPKIDHLRREAHAGQGLALFPVNGEQISGFTATRILQRDGWPEAVAQTLRSLVPSVVDFNVKREGTMDVLVFRVATGGTIRAEEMSPGTLFAFFLSAYLREHRPPATILFDDLDNGLHPSALATIATLLRRVVTGQGAESQIFATCHSPYMIDHFKADEVIVTCPLDDGMSIAAPLSRHPDYERWKDELSTGDFWRTVGEAWVKDLPGIMEPLP